MKQLDFYQIKIIVAGDGICIVRNVEKRHEREKSRVLHFWVNALAVVAEYITGKKLGIS